MAVLGPFRLLPLFWVVWGLLLSSATAQITNPLSLCSKQNTGASGDAAFNAFNSFGSCTNHCGGYAFAIMQGNKCWCSNVAPGDTASVSECSDSCPGFNTDRCGNTAEGLYGYAQLGTPSSTMAASSAAPSTSSSSSSQESSSESSATSSSSSSPQSSSQSSSGPSSDSSSGSASSSPSASSSGAPSGSSQSSSGSSTTSASASEPTSSTKSTSVAPSFIVSFITLTGQVQTVTQSVSPPSGTSQSGSGASSSSSESSGAITAGRDQQKNGRGFWHNTGAVAGVFTAVGVVVLALILLALFLFCRRRRRQEYDEAASNHTNLTGQAASTHHTNSSSPHSQKKFAESSTFDENDAHLVPIFDQRVDPTQMYMRWDQTASQQSLQDNQDYSRRVLRVANPDHD